MISIVLPVHQQADHLAQIVRGHAAALAKLPLAHEFILVENGSRDGTWERCQELAGELDVVRAIRSEPPGWGRAVRTGLHSARGDVLCYTNSARTSTEDLVYLLIYAAGHPDTAIKADRRVREGLGRRLGSFLYNLECRALLGTRTRDVNGTPKIFPRRFAALLELRRDDDLIDAEFLYRCRVNGYPVVEVPVSSWRRHGGRSTTRLGSALRMYLGVWRLARSLGRGRA